MTENEISYIVRGAIFDVYNYFAPGLLESIYKEALFIQLREKLNIKREVAVPAKYLDHDLGIGFRIDLLVEEKVIVEIKAIRELSDVHKKQLVTYLKLTGLKLGILVNFNSENISKSITRIVNDL